MGGYTYTGVVMCPSDESPIYMNLNTTFLPYLANITNATFSLGIVYDGKVELHTILKLRNWNQYNDGTYRLNYEIQSSDCSYYKYPLGSARNLSFHISANSTDPQNKNRIWLGESNTVNGTVIVTQSGKDRPKISVDLVDSHTGVIVDHTNVPNFETILIKNGEWDFSLNVCPVFKVT
jgi:hypothetical protein